MTGPLPAGPQAEPQPELLSGSDPELKQASEEESEPGPQPGRAEVPRLRHGRYRGYTGQGALDSGLHALLRSGFVGCGGFVRCDARKLAKRLLFMMQICIDRELLQWNIR